MKPDKEGSRNVLFAAFGSLGDIHPSIALASELKARGHRPVIAASPDYQDKIKAFDIVFRPVRPANPEPAVLRRAAEDGAEVLLREVLLPHLQESYEDTAAAADGMEFLISSPLAYAARLLAEKDGLPWASLLLAPMSLFSAHDMPVLRQLPQGMRDLNLNIRQQVVNAVKSEIHTWAEPIHRLRHKLELPPLQQTLLDYNSPELILALFSDLLSARQPDWPIQAVTTGFPFLDGPSPPALSPALEKFLNDGPAPIVFTLGSIEWRAAGEFYYESASAAASLGMRAVLLIADSSTDAFSGLGPDIIAVNYAPFAAVFPRAAVIVHHGGIGATGEAMRAGKPMIIVPFCNDQPDNAARAGRLGIARTIAREEYRAPRVERELRILLSYPQYKTNGEAVKRQVQDERGVIVACDKLEHWFSFHPSVACNRVPNGNSSC